MRATERIPRTHLVDVLTQHRDVPVVLVEGASGSGKSTLVDDWTSLDDRAVATVRLRTRHDDPVLLLDALVDALDGCEPVGDAFRHTVLRVDVDYSSVVLPALERVLQTRSTPFLLVLDDVHVLQSAQCWAVLQSLADEVPPGSQVVLISRHATRLSTGRLAAQGRLWSLDPDDLLFTSEETAALLSLMRVHGDGHVHERTGGWPVAVYLAAMAMAEQGASASPAQSVAETSALAAYLRDEVLDALPSAQREFLLRTAVLDELSAPACDAVLAGTQSAPLLQALARDRHLVVPVDGAPGTFRIHQLVRELLLSQLAHATPAEIVVLHQRASEWYAARGDLDAAIEHAFAAGVDDDVDQLVWRAYIPFLGGGLSHTVSRWLDAVEYDAKRARPVFAVTSAWHALTIGDMPSTRLWCEIVNGLDPELCLPDGTPVAVVAALMRALVAGDGIVAMRDDALLAERGHARSAPLRTMTLLLAGHGERLLGNDAAARRLLEEGVAFGALVNPAGEIHCRIGLALMAAAAGDWTTATASSERAFELIEALGLQNRPAMSLPTAITAYLWAREGRSEARDLLKRGVFLVSALGGVGAWMGIEARVWLARAARQLGDPSTARGLVDEAEALVPEASESSMLAAAVSSLESLDARALVLTLHATPMTPAELRVLRYLPTHLTFAAIASELFVSRNTVKTQAIAVYRKLGVTSREGAVEEARRLGLLDS